MSKIRSLFENPIDREIEGVIKADDDRHLVTEVDEFVITTEVQPKLGELLENYVDGGASNGVWISGFFGSGKSHLLKMLSLLLQNRNLEGKSVADRFLEKPDDEFLKGAIERAVKIPSRSILFNVDLKAHNIGGDPQSALLAVFVKVLNEEQGYYAKEDYVANFERYLDKRGIRQKFNDAYEASSGSSWEEHVEDIDTIENDTFARVYAEFLGKSEEEGLRYFDRAREKYKLSIEDFADRVKNYLDSLEPGARVNFFVDEVGQFIGKDSKLMLNLQTIAEALSTVCEGRAWVFVTSQGDLKKILGGLDGESGDDFSKIQGRFGNKIMLSSSDVTEVIQRRLLSKSDAEPAELVTLYDREKENIRTLFTFGDDSRDYRPYRDADHFYKLYPFLPYQVDLCQTAIERLSQHDAFTGKHQSVGERSMLAIFHEIVKRLGSEQTGAFATFDLMFEGLKSVLRGEFQTSVIKAERTHSGDRPLCVRVLKCLFLLKWVTEFKSTHKNVAILLIDRPDIDIVAHEKAVKEQLNYLESQSYLQRTGEFYEFLTDEEKDVEVEIKNTEIDGRSVPNLLADVLFKDILGDPKIRFDANKHDYVYTRKLDDHVVGKTHDFAINIITSEHDNAGDLATLRAQNTGKRELLVVLPDDSRAADDARAWCKTERYLREAAKSGLSESKRAIHRERGLQNASRRKEMGGRCSALLAESTFVLNGSKIDVSGTEAKTRIFNAFQKLVSQVYPNLRMLKVSYPESKISEILDEEDDLLSEALNEAEQEIMTRLNRAKMGSERLHIDELVTHFGAGQYGWPGAATLCLLARLFRRHKVEFKEHADPLSSDEVKEVLNNSRRQGGVSVQVQEEFDAATVSALKTFHQDFFHSANPGSDAKSAAQATLDAFEKEVVQMDKLLVQTSEFPFVEDLKAVRDRIDGIAQKDYTYPLRKLREFDNDLLDARDDLIDPIKTFVNGASGTLFGDIRNFLRDQSGNLNPSDERTVTLREVESASAPYRGDLMRRAKAALDALRPEVTEALEERKKEVLTELKKRESELRKHPKFEALESARQEEILKDCRNIEARVEAANLIPVVSQELEAYLENGFPNQLTRLEAAGGTSPGGGGTKASETQPKPAYVSLKAALAEIQFDKSTLKTSEDVDAFADKFRSHLKETIESGKGIIL
jgi:hypothetical protein